MIDMNWLDQDKAIKFGIRSKIISGFFVISILFIISVIIILYEGNRNLEYSNLVANKYLPTQHDIVDLQTAIVKSNDDFVKFLFTKESKFKSNIQLSWGVIDSFVSKIQLEKSFTGEDEKVVWAGFLNQLKIFRDTQNELLMQISNTAHASDEVVKIYLNIYLPEFEKLNSYLNNDKETEISSDKGIFDLQTDILRSGINSLVNQTLYFDKVGVVLVIISVLLAIFISIFVSNKITNPLNKAVKAAKDIASGSRDVVLEANSTDETGLLMLSLSNMQKAIKDAENDIRRKELEARESYSRLVECAKILSSHCTNVSEGDLRGRLALEDLDNEIMKKLGEDLNVMTDSLTNITSQITDASHDIVTTLEEVRHSVDVQSSGASEQASSINEITASLGEIEKSTAQTADKAKALGEAAIKTQEKGRLGVESVEESIRGMRLVRDKVQLIAQTIMELSSQTQQVGEITAVVNNLAQQSKMLALNASIEAAKAGEAGKGFAVVASEVKNLAEQSEQSTSQVQKILEDIRKATERAVMVTEEGTKGVDYGTGLIEKTGELVISLNDVIREATIASQQIEAAISQECVGVEQITVGMNEINQVTASFVESARQTTEAISNLSDIARDLKSNVDSYKV